MRAEPGHHLRSLSVGPLFGPLVHRSASGVACVTPTSRQLSHSARRCQGRRASLLEVCVPVNIIPGAHHILFQQELRRKRVWICPKRVTAGLEAINGGC